ncbi:FAD-binding and (Fe-S)-binding domain-containing protein [Azotosporobacter soli]|uniref:FAD-binding and (Fe-S)-binding domain-containing protein n=1 Tax=Azotosporobacter soli TaxID=3055040 RepID=UPI0031FEBD3D
MGLQWNARDVARLPEAYRRFYSAIQPLVGRGRIFADPIRTLAYGVDASLYRINPKLVVQVRNVSEVVEVLKQAHACAVPVTFRGSGTSLSGQALSNSVLVVAAAGWDGYSIAPGGESITLAPGILGVEANQYLKDYGRKIGPDPASINHAVIGGIAANNASGMCCGTADNSYKTIESLQVVFADGTFLDTGDPASREAFCKAKPELLAGLSALRDEIEREEELREFISRKFKIKNTTGYGLNSFVDYQDPFDIINHILIGSEGTLGFIARITYRTVVDHAHKASALMLFPDIGSACQAVMQLSRPLVAAAELIDRVSLRSVEDRPGMPEHLKTLPEEAAALLVEIRAEEREQLQSRIGEVETVLADIPKLMPISFTDKKAEYEMLWKIRSGIFPAVGGMRKPGTTVIIEDVAFPKAGLGDAVLALRRLMNEHGYQDGIIYGHALDGNVHFVFSQDFSTQEELKRYEEFMAAICRMVVEDHQGSLKAEHGTGRNVAPFVELEWGPRAYALMKRIKDLFDPQRLLNPDVILTDNPLLHLADIKAAPRTHEIVDKCIECGYCEVNCPSKNLTSTPRQRIAIQREIVSLQQSGADEARRRRLESDYEYFGEITCAADGLCETTCPVGINTGSFTKQLRADQTTVRGRKIAKFIAGNFSRVSSMAKLGLGGANLAHSLLGGVMLGGLAGGMRNLSGGHLPKWTPWMPKAGSSPAPRQEVANERERVIYFPSCVTRMMGPAKEDLDQRQLHEVMLSLFAKADYQVLLPKELEDLCCGMPFESKGYFEAANQLSDRLETVLLALSEDGKIPVVCDTSPCVYRMKRVMDKRLKILDTVEALHDLLLPRLAVTPLDKTVALHVTCSATKLGLTDKFKAVANACATKVIVPPKVRCCGFAGDKGFEVPELNESALEHLAEALPPDCASGYSNSRTCEIGLAERSGFSYQSIAYLADRCSKAKR